MGDTGNENSGQSGGVAPQRPAVEADPAGHGFCVASESMFAVLRRMNKVANLDTTVLLTGESGTGKELAAGWLHRTHRQRRNRPFVRVHCGAIPDTLLESELFGHVRGAFTGAERDRPGVFEQAHGGTLFLDEISTMSAQAQVRLLRVLQERQVTRLGATETRPVDVRVIVASNEDLRQLVDRGEFRLDLFYRVNTFPIALPPLRERPSDISTLTELFGVRVAQRMKLPTPKTFGAEALATLAAYSWPGNVRELENAVEHAFILAEGSSQVGPEHLPADISGMTEVLPADLGPVHLTEEGLSLRNAVTNLERQLILQSLRLAEGNKARAAKLLHLKRTTFLEKLARLEEGAGVGLQPDRSSPDAGSKLAV